MVIFVTIKSKKMEKKIFFKNKDGLNLCGVLTEPLLKTDKCAVLCHGITALGKDGEIYSELAKKLAEKGIAAFRFDFRGHNESEGNSINLTVSGEQGDLADAMGFLAGCGYKNFVIAAASFGAGPVCLFLVKNPSAFKAVALWNPIIDYDFLIEPKLAWPQKYFGAEAMALLKKQGYIEIGFGKLKIGQALIDEIRILKPWKALEGVEAPILFLHSDKDDYVPYEDSVKYSALLGAKLVTIIGVKHGFHAPQEIADKAISTTLDFFLANF
jgi:uncharacterized protein